MENQKQTANNIFSKQTISQLRSQILSLCFFSENQNIQKYLSVLTTKELFEEVIGVPLHKESSTTIKDNWSCLHLVCSRGFTSTLSTFLLHPFCDEKLINQTNVDGQTCLHLAVQNKHLHIVSLLLQYHCDPNIIDLNGNSALHYALEEKDFSIIPLLVDYGANLFQKNNEKIAPIDFPFQYDDLGDDDDEKEEVKDLKIDERIFKTLITSYHRYIEQKYQKQKFNEKKENVKEEEREEKQKEKEEIEEEEEEMKIYNSVHKYIIVNNNNNKEEEKRYSILHKCVESIFSPECILYLISVLHFPVDQRSFDSIALTPLHIAAKIGYYRGVDVLIQCGADVNAKTFNKNCRTALHFASHNNHSLVVQLLIENNANLEIRDQRGPRGKTALEWALKLQHKEICEILLSNGAIIPNNLKNTEPSEKNFVEREMIVHNRNQSVEQTQNVNLSKNQKRKKKRNEQKKQNLKEINKPNNNNKEIHSDSEIIDNNKTTS